MQATWGELLEGVGLDEAATKSRRAYTSGWLDGLARSKVTSIAAATGTGESLLLAMTLDRFNAAIVESSALREGSIESMLWLRDRRSRFCPRCLKENGGRWYVCWRLRWGFVA